MAQLTKARMDEMKENNYLRYAKVVSDENVVRAIIRILELQPLQSSVALINTDNRLEYSALMRILDDLSWGRSTSGNKMALSIWLDNRQIALTMATFKDGEPHTQRATAEQEISLSSLLIAKQEADARKLDNATIEAALRMQAEGTLEQHITMIEQSEQAADYVRRNTPMDVGALVRDKMAEYANATK